MRIAGDFLSTSLQVEERHRFSRLDLNFAFVILALNLIGLINLYSATHGLFSKDKMDLFWMQLELIQPESFIADGSLLNFVTCDGQLFATVSAALR